MSAIYLDKYGWPAYVEDDQSRALPAEQVKGLERVEIEADRIAPGDIFQFMRRTVWPGSVDVDDGPAAP